MAKAAGRWRAEHFVVERDGTPLAIAATIAVRVAGLTLVSRMNRGPLFLDAAPSRETVREVFRAVRQRWQFLLRGALLIAPNLERTEENRELLRSVGFRQRAERTWGSGRIDLRQSEEEIWASFDAKFRNQARKADKAGATLEVDDGDAAFEWMLERHQANMQEKGFAGSDAAFLRRLRAAAGPQNLPVFRVVHEGEPVSGGIAYRFGPVAEYYVGWVGPAGRDLAAGNHMLWSMIRDMKTRGCAAFDVGGMSGGEKYSRFKQGTNPVPYDLAGEWIAC